MLHFIMVIQVQNIKNIKLFRVNWCEISAFVGEGEGGPELLGNWIPETTVNLESES